MRFLSILLLCVLSVPIDAAVIRAETVRAAEAVFDAVSWTPTVDRHEVDVGRVRFDALALDARGLRVRCGTGLPDACSGTLTARGWPRYVLSADFAKGVFSVVDGQTRLSLDAADPAWRVEAKELPLSWLLPRAQRGWPTLVSLDGRADLSLTLGDPAWTGTYALRGLSFDQADGQVAGAALTGTGTVDWAMPTSRLALAVTATQGEFLLGALYRAVDQPLQTMVAIDMATPAWRIESLAVDEGRHLRLRAAAALDAAGNVTQVSIDDLALSLPAAQPWLDPMLAGAGYAGLVMAGDARLSGRWQPGGWQLGRARIERLDITDPQSRIVVGGISLDAHLQPAPAAGADAIPVSRLSWQSLALFGMPFSASTFDWRWQPHDLAQVGTTETQLFGGSLAISGLRRAEGAWRGSVRLRDIDFAALTEQLGWPAFGGHISADLSGFTLADGRLSVPGEIEVRAFDGRIGIQDLVAERLFGDSPAFAADIRMDDLDLRQLTAALSFGEIQGRLDGYVTGLRLLDWSPIAFDARFQNDRKPGVKQRISRRAVEGLSKIGGGGLDNAFIGLVDSFGYAALGIGCRLKENVCTMDGIDSDGPGYTIVQGSGLPRLTVNGFQRRVDWPVMVRRLKAAATGSGPVIE